MYRTVTFFMLSIMMLLSTFAPHSVNADKDTIDVTETENETFSWDNATVYFAMTDRFLDGDPTNNNSYGRPQEDAWGQNIGTFHGGDFQGLTDKLNDGYFTDLGINSIWISAPYEQVHGWVGGGPDGDFAHYAFHGYYALDYTMTDQNWGTVEDMREFVDTAHENGIRVVLDVVMNHPGYNTLQDMHEYGFGNPGVSTNWTPSSGQSWHDVHNYINYNDADAWRSWWGQWVRAGIAGYPSCGNNDRTQCLAGLPDFRTELTESIGLPPLLETKWEMERDGSYDEWIVPAADDLRADLNMAPADYIVEWLSAWVAEFGIDGFRVDTAKHVELERWDQLKESANDALWTWREENPDAPGADWTDDFWMTAEVWGHGVGRSEYFDHGFDSVINFTFQGENGNGPAYNLATMESTFSRYANAINSDPGFNVLSYLSQHDTHLFPRDNLIDGGTYLMLLPGGVQVFYGDETARPYGPTGSDPDQGTRSSMNWNEVNESVLHHWQIMGQFRNSHIAIGAGEHEQIGSSPYTFSRTYQDDDLEDSVVVAIGASGATTIDVSSVFSDGQVLRDFYTEETAVVSNGDVTFQAHDSGVILIERAGEAPPTVTASPQGGEFDEESLEVTLHVSGTESGMYTLDGSNPADEGVIYENGDVITIGEDLAVDESVTLQLYAENDAGEAEADYTFTKTPPYPSVAADPPGGTFTGDGVEVTLSARNVEEAMYVLNDSEAVAYENGDTLLLGEGADTGDVITLTLTGQNEYGTVEETYEFTKAEGLTLYYRTDWSQPHIHYAIDDGSWTDSPGVAMEPSPFEGYAMITLDVDEQSKVTAAFNNGSGQWDNNQGQDYHITSGVFTLEDGQIREGDPESPATVTLYYYTNWSNPHIHYAIGSGNWTTLPGKALTASSNFPDYYEVTIPLEDANSLTAAFNNGASSWDNNQGRDYSFTPGIHTVRNGRITAGVPRQ
ncbi:alpha-amylase [Salipaludibacillus agaradhaerens]|uniref:carbohydrate binding domain-containing protein n=1 Tax=Salipaludibacillus agaradhaerens TaxID=76935 RepID=UPI002151F9AE|nr:carbohydrate binding domain-containing protein [Salipaludibacillus agaradhaerens]MCR6108383.1 alpha-amylase [Salipaludibacillus agaradhaerens]MCR6120406.1 alpha-amylase [Salipaludibacillus agaradhaerens]